MKNINSIPRIALVLFLLGWCSLGFSQVSPIADSYTNTATPTTNYGAKPLLDVDGATQVSYIQFNLASIPSGASISQATLKLYVNSVTTAGSFNVDYLNSAWSESTIDTSNAPLLGGSIASNVDITMADKNQYILINVTSAVQAWLSGTETNNGIALVANSTFNATFDSKENTTTSHPPELDIAYAGGDGTITGLTTASGSGLTGGGTSGTLNLSLTDACGTGQVLQWNGSSWACAAVGTGTITGVTAGTGLTGGGATGNVTLNLNTSALNTTYAQLGSNIFTGNQAVNGNVSATGVVSASAFYDSVGTQIMSISPGLYDLYLGQSAGQGAGANNTGSYNTSAGFQTLFLNTSGTQNAAVGWKALYNNTTGSQNTAAGLSALGSNTTGAGNTGVGINALYSNTTGGTNTADGNGALYGNSSGSNNTASGFLAGGSVDGSPITGSSNTFLGTSSVLSTGSLQNATAIGANAEVAENNALVLGSINGVNNATASTNVGIGTIAPAYSLDVHGTGNFTGLVTFASGQTFPGTGTITGITAGAGLAGGGSSGSVPLSLASNACSSGNALTALPFTCSAFATLASNAFTGNQSVTGSVTAVGTMSGAVVNATTAFDLGGIPFAYGSNLNTFLGTTGNSTNTGSGNTVIGHGAMEFNTSGYENVATGLDALEFNTMGEWNSGIGTGTLLENTTGNYNTAVGGSALYYNTTGSNNTALGVNAGIPTSFTYTTGSSDTFLGAYSSSGTQTNLSNATAIGANSQVSTNNALVLGSINGVNNATADTYVGIGTTAPGNPLQIVGNSTYVPLAVQSSSTFGTWMNLANTSTGAATWSILSAASGNSEGAGNLAFTNFNPSSTVYIHANLHVDGTVSKGGGSFQIDDPLDPANKYLYHSFVESPDMMNVYNGNITTNQRGVATVVLPDYFEALNRDFRYQLTVIGQFAQAIVAKEIVSGRFMIKTSKPGVKVSWQVTGIRRDAYANAHRIPVEQEKSSEEQGHYLHPELFGAPPEKAIGYWSRPFSSGIGKDQGGGAE